MGARTKTINRGVPGGKHGAPGGSSTAHGHHHPCPELTLSVLRQPGFRLQTHLCQVAPKQDGQKGV